MATKTRPRTTSTSTSTSTKPKSSERRSNPNSRFARLAGLQRLFKDTVTEMKKITWPDRDATRNLTIVVVAISVTLGAALGGIDALFVRVWQAIP